VFNRLIAAHASFSAPRMMTAELIAVLQGDADKSSQGDPPIYNGFLNGALPNKWMYVTKTWTPDYTAEDLLILIFDSVNGGTTVSSVADLLLDMFCTASSHDLGHLVRLNWEVGNPSIHTCCDDVVGQRFKVLM